jgi:hypothetical protein
MYVVQANLPEAAPKNASPIQDGCGLAKQNCAFERCMNLCNGVRETKRKKTNDMMHMLRGVYII